MAEAKYTVAPGNSFTSQGIIYQGGDDIPAAVFADKSVLAAFVSEGRIIETAEKKVAEKPYDPEVFAEVPVKKSSRKKE